VKTSFLRVFRKHYGIGFISGNETGQAKTLIFQVGTIVLGLMIASEKLIEAREKLRDLLQTSPSQLDYRAYVAFIQEEMRETEVDLNKLLIKYGVNDVFAMDQLIQEGKVDEESAWEDFFAIDALTYKRAQLNAVLEDLNSV